MRKRFTREEREVLQPGTAVEWRNVSHWHPGTVLSTPEPGLDGWWTVKLTNHASTRTVTAGELITGTPGSVRLPQTPDVAPAGAPAGLCPPCARQWLAWGNYKPTPPVTLVQIGRPTVRRVTDTLNLRERDRRELIKQQRGLITTGCAANHHAA